MNPIHFGAHFGTLFLINFCGQKLAKKIQIFRKNLDLKKCGSNTSVFHRLQGDGEKNVFFRFFSDFFLAEFGAQKWFNLELIFDTCLKLMFMYPNDKLYQNPCKIQFRFLGKASDIQRKSLQKFKGKGITIQEGKTLRQHDTT